MNNFVIRKSNRLNIKEGDVLRCLFPEFKYNKIGQLTIAANDYPFEKTKYWELIDVYLLSDETLVTGDVILTDSYGVWEFKEQPCPIPYWGNPNICKKILKSTDLKYEMSRFEQEELIILIKKYNDNI